MCNRVPAPGLEIIVRLPPSGSRRSRMLNAEFPRKADAACAGTERADR